MAKLETGQPQPTADAMAQAASRITQPGATYYEILGVSENSSHDVINTAWRNIASLLHPDKVASCIERGIVPKSASDAYDRAFLTVSEAIDVLKDPQKRAEYDSALGKNDGHINLNISVSSDAREAQQHLQRLVREFRATVLGNYGAYFSIGHVAQALTNKHFAEIIFSEDTSLRGIIEDYLSRTQAVTKDNVDTFHKLLSAIDLPDAERRGQLKQGILNIVYHYSPLLDFVRPSTVMEVWKQFVGSINESDLAILNSDNSLKQITSPFLLVLRDRFRKAQ